MTTLIMAMMLVGSPWWVLEGTPTSSECNASPSNYLLRMDGKRAELFWVTFPAVCKRTVLQSGLVRITCRETESTSYYRVNRLITIHLRFKKGTVSGNLTWKYWIERKSKQLPHVAAHKNGKSTLCRDTYKIKGHPR